MNSRGRRQEQVDSRHLTLHSADFERDSTQEQVDSRRLTLHSADFERDCTLVQRHSSKYQTYCAFSDKSTKVGTYVE